MQCKIKIYTKFIGFFSSDSTASVSYYTEILKKYWAYDRFRPLQEEIIESICSGSDTLVLLPTGGGKSLCYQVPGMAMEGLCLVISPLIALMNDQVHQLKRRNIKAIAVSSRMNKREIDIALDNAVYGDYKFLYLPPERLQSPLFLERLPKMNICLIAVDEAHCISQWGYDFRPSYLNIASIRDIKQNTPIIALTASASQKVVSDIAEKLQLRKANHFKQSFTRSNLSYVVFNEEDKEKKLINILSKVKASAIVYAKSRKKTETLSQLLSQNSISSDYYHAGLSAHQREERQSNWMSNKTRVMVATNAFGMGIDKPDVRTVVHFDICENPENYYQEAGRAGRDGEKSYAVQLFNAADVEIGNKRVLNKFPELKTIKEVYHKLGNYFNLGYGAGSETSFAFDLGKFASFASLPSLQCYYALKIIEKNEYLILNELDNSPSKIRMVMKHGDIYDYQLRNEKHSLLIDILLRSYSGLFDEYVAIDEYLIAKRLKSPVQKLIKQLDYLSESNVLEYLRRSESGSIFWSRERVPSDQLRIEKNTYSERKKVALRKWQDMKDYVNNKEMCRSKLLVSFFDEVNASNCGICDICIDRKKKGEKGDSFNSLVQEICELVKDKPLGISDLTKKIDHCKEDELLYAIRWLSDQNAIEMKENLMHWVEK